MCVHDKLNYVSHCVSVPSEQNPAKVGQINGLAAAAAAAAGLSWQRLCAPFFLIFDCRLTVVCPSITTHYCQSFA